MYISYLCCDYRNRILLSSEARPWRGYVGFTDEPYCLTPGGIWQEIIWRVVQHDDTNPLHRSSLAAGRRGSAERAAATWWSRLIALLFFLQVSTAFKWAVRKRLCRLCWNVSVHLTEARWRTISSCRETLILFGSVESSEACEQRNVSQL